MPDYELLEMVRFAAIPRGEVKPLAKRLLKRFGSFADAIASPPDILSEVEGMGEASVAAFHLALNKITQTPGTMIYGNTTAF
jgi:DNA repair protein RadC